MVRVWFGSHIDLDYPSASYPVFKTSGSARYADLGLAVDQINQEPKYKFKPVTPDDFGDTAAEVIVMAADASVRMRLIHWDSDVLDACSLCSQAGNVSYANTPVPGILMGNNLALLASGNYFMRLSLLSRNGNAYKETRYPAAYLDDEPYKWPIGTEATILDLKWKAIPYTRMNAVSGAGGVAYGDVSALTSGNFAWQFNPNN